ncbi:MAG: hypothetical protein JST92_07545, partial [Deltaproteobacteria bacterium]|nr:hypothetical protein [Deltaproteobacteria bacterium]
MRSLLCVVACLAVAASASAQTVVVSPNTIHGQIGFDNTDPGVLAVLQSSGLAFVAESAYSTSPSGYSTNGYAYVTGSPTLSPYSLSGEADGNQGHVTYNLQVSGGLNQRPGYSTGAAQYQFGTKQVDLLPVGQQPDGIS